METLVFVLFCLALQAPLGQAVDIQGVSISGSGETIDAPVNEEGGSPAVLKCDISGVWGTCKWLHSYKRERSEVEEEFYCPITRGSGSSQCDPDNVDPGYKRRIKIEEKSSSCELKISNPNYMDSGIWECLVDSGPDDSYVRDSMEIFVSRKAEMYISEPDMESGGNQYIVYNLEDRRPKIYSKCRAYHAIPPPEFHWYVNEVSPRNEINGQDVVMSDPKVRKDSRGDFYEHTLDWSPKELCKNYNIDPVVCENEEFEFDLLCTIDQKEYYASYNEDNVQRVMVRVLGNSGVSLRTCLSLLLLSSISSYLLL